MTFDPKKRRRRPGDEETDSLSRWLLGGLGLLSLGALAARLFRRKPRKEETREAAEVTEPIATPIRGHESRDANPSWIFVIIIFLFVFGMGIHGILAWFLSALKNKVPPRDQWQPLPGVASALPPPPPYPVLQVSPAADLKEFRTHEDSELSSYGWIDRTSGIVRLPIERAMELVLQQGLPARTSTNASRTGPSTYQLMQQRPLHRQEEIQYK